jgi:hypothetical protein
MWQDTVLTIGTMIFIIALLPSVFGSAKPAAMTSLMTGTVLAIFAVTYTMLPDPLWFAAVTTATTSTVWFVLFGQAVWPRIRQWLAARRQVPEQDRASVYQD